MTSDGPVNADGTPTTPSDATSRLAVATHALPGPTMTPAAATLSVPYAMAPIACTPPMRYTASTPASAAAASVSAATAPSLPGGTHRTTSPTPATRAGTAVMRTVDGYRARPPGT